MAIMNERTQRLTQLDQAHVWHPFTPMRQWRQQPQLIIDRAEGEWLIDTEGNRYLDGVSSLWCNVHGHRVPAIDDAIRAQLDQVAHTTLLGLASPPSIELAAKLAHLAPGKLAQVFYSDAGATAVEVAFKMAVGYWHHRGRPGRCRFIGIAGAYHGDTTGAMSVGVSELFHRPFLSMLFPTYFMPAPDAPRAPAELLERYDDPQHPARDAAGRALWPSENPDLSHALREHCLSELRRLLEHHQDEVAAVVVEPLMQGAAGMICQPPGFLRGVAELAREFGVLLIADEVATGFGRTGSLFACEQEDVQPDLLCVAKGLTGGYLPLAATLATPDIAAAFEGELHEKRTLYHGHTYTGNPLACAAALASLDLFAQNHLLAHIQQSAQLIHEHLHPLRDCPHVLDIRQRGVMVGIELCRDRQSRQPFDFSRRTAAAVCHALRGQGILLRPLGDVLVLMPVPAMRHDLLAGMVDAVVSTLQGWRFD